MEAILIWPSWLPGVPLQEFMQREYYTAGRQDLQIQSVRSINNQELVYRSRKVNSHATIIRKRGSTVPVLVWEIQPTDEYRLDIYEGYPRYYFKKDKII